MVVLPQNDFRGLALSFGEFFDLVIIGMVGLNQTLMKGATPPRAGCMVNYKRVADNLGLIYEPHWIDDVGNALENSIESLVSHDCAPDGEEDDGRWVYLNSGITRIGELLKEKYYIAPSRFELNYEEFRDIFLFELAGIVQDNITVDVEGADWEIISSLWLST
ncbi:MAG: hypothetical protein HQL39_00325 [Alphaproteobacteria bacterium]|nr:hypothetical protein [Alphaproteobacteria bacterium]